MKTASVSITELRRDPMMVVASMSTAGHPHLLTRNGEPVAALIDLDTLRRLDHELELLRRLALGEVESAAGVGHTLAEVLADCDLLLEGN